MSEDKPSTVEVYKVLQSIDLTLKHLLALAEARGRKATSNGTSVASDADLDGQYGDPEIKAKDPRDWNGDSMKGKRMSECPPEYLDMIADRLDYFTSQLGTSDEDKKKAVYNRKDAARARGWAARKRAGWQLKAQSLAETPYDGRNPFDDSSVEF